MENQVTSLVDALPDIVWTALPDGNVDFLNQRWYEYTGLSDDRAYGQSWQAAIHPADLAELLDRWRAILASCERGDIEARIRRFDGEYRQFLFRARPITNPSGQVVKWCGMTFDIEDQRQAAEEALRVGEGHFRAIADSIPAQLAVMTPTGEVESANRQFLEYIGATLEELKGWAPGDTVHPDDSPLEIAAWKRSVATGEPFDIEMRTRRTDRGYRWVHVRGLPVKHDDGRITGWYVLQTDIDDRKRAQAQLAGEKRLLEMVASGYSLPDVLNALCRFVEDTATECSCGVYLIDWSGPTFHHAAAPSVPATFYAPIDGAVLGDEIGPCAIAARLKTQVIAADIESDLQWKDSAFRTLALANGIKSCWSTPIYSLAGTVLGTFALYQRTPASPTPLQLDLIAQVTHIASIAIERTQSDAALKRSEARKAAILDSALDCIVTIDHEGCITEFNPAAERTFGFGRDQVLGKNLADVIIPSSLREEHRRGLTRYLATGEARVLERRVEMTAVRADGSEFPVELAVTRIPLDGPPSFTGYLRDITEHKQSEEELRRSEAFLAQAQRLSSTGSFVWRVATDEITFSEQSMRIFEFDQDERVTLELIGSRVHPEDIPMLSEAIDRARSDRHGLDYEIRLQMPDHSIKYLQTIAQEGRNQDGQLEYFGAIQDVTERRLSEEALSKARSELADVARFMSLGALTASIAHEVSQPLSGIITNASTCLRMLAADPPNVAGARETARRAIRDGNRASEVLKRLRALFSHQNATTESVDLNEATREVIALSRSELQSSHVILLMELADDLPPVPADRVQLQQVVLNLLLNASDAMSGVEDRPRRVVVRTERDDGNHIRLSVKDAGVGLNPQSLDRIFEAFYTTKTGGMGIGLSVSRSIIERHRGRLWATPNDGPGATFSFSIPQRSEDVTGAHRTGDMLSAAGAA